MDTHFHIVVHGLPENIASFELQIRRSFTRYFGLSQKELQIHYEPISDDIELMRKIVYVFRNPIDAGFPFLPDDYPWGIGGILFHRPSSCEYRRIGDFSVRQRQEMFHTQMKLPEEWMVDDDGMILPRCYVDVDAVQELFGSPKRFISFLFVRKKDLVEQEARDACAIMEQRSDSHLHSEAESLSQRLFGGSLTKRSDSERLKIAKDLWLNHRTLSHKQLARAVRIDAEILEVVLH